MYVVQYTIVRYETFVCRAAHTQKWWCWLMTMMTAITIIVSIWIHSMAFSSFICWIVSLIRVCVYAVYFVLRASDGWKNCTLTRAIRWIDAHTHIIKLMTEWNFMNRSRIQQQQPSLNSNITADNECWNSCWNNWFGNKLKWSAVKKLCVQKDGTDEWNEVSRRIYHLVDGGAKQGMIRYRMNMNIYE